MPALLLRHWPKLLALLLVLGAGVGGYLAGRRSAPAPVELSEKVGESSTTTEAKQETTAATGRRNVQRARHTVREKFDATGRLLEREETTAGAVVNEHANTSGTVNAQRQETREAARETTSRAAPAAPWRVSALVGVDASTLSLTAPPALRVGASVQYGFPLPLVRVPAHVGGWVLVTPDAGRLRPEVGASFGVSF